MARTITPALSLSAFFILFIIVASSPSGWAADYDGPSSHVVSGALPAQGRALQVLASVTPLSTAMADTVTTTTPRSLFSKIMDFLRNLFGNLFVPKQADSKNGSKETAVETPIGTATVVVQKTQTPEPATPTATTSSPTTITTSTPTLTPTPTPSPTPTTVFVVKTKEAVNPEFKNWTDNKISLEIPTDWEVITYGDCATKSFIARDPKNPILQAFYFSEAGPVYTRQAQKDSDIAYVNMGGYHMFYMDAPVVSPFNAQSFLLNFKALAETPFMKKSAPLAPKLTDIQVISTQASASKLLPSADSAETIRALFKQDGALGEGLFYVETYTFTQSSFGYGMTFIGMSAGSGNFSAYEAALDRIIKSYEFNQSYVSACLQAQAQALSGALKVGKTLSETSDIIMSSWENRQRSDDILSERWSDATLGYERVYDPATGDVYRVENGFYDNYNTHRENYGKSDLELLPENNWALWNAPTLPQSDIR